MLLKSFGCSFIFGTELADDISSEMLDWSDPDKFIHPSKLTWPALLANDRKCEYISKSLPGIGNFQILETILKELAQPNNDLFVIQWTWIDRFDYENILRNKRKNFWNTILPGDTDRVAEWYFKYVHSQYRDKLTTLTCIKTAIDALQQNNVPFIMANIDDLVFETEWHTNDAIEYLQDYIKPHITNFNGLNFLDWAKTNGFPIGAYQHPLEEAHRAAFELVKSYNLV